MQEKISVIKWEQIDEITKGISQKIIKDKFMPDIIISVVRGGMIPSVILSHQLNVRNIKNIVVKVTINDSINAKKMPPQLEADINLTDIKNKNILIVDDIIGTGQTLKKICQELERYKPKQVKTAICFVNKENWEKSNVKNYSEVVNYLGEEIRGWVVFPWENSMK